MQTRKRTRNLEEENSIGDGPQTSPGTQVIVRYDGTSNEQQVWPFVKKSFLWPIIESVLDKKQKPHFSPLKNMNKCSREGYAIGLTVVFQSIFQDVLNYQLSIPDEEIKEILATLDELELHGFDVSAVRDRLNTFLSSTAEVRKLKDELKKAENDIKICNVLKRDAEEEVNGLEAKIQELENKIQEPKNNRSKQEVQEKIQELREKMVRNENLKVVKEQETKRLKLDITKVEYAVKNLANMPL